MAAHHLRSTRGADDQPHAGKLARRQEQIGIGELYAAVGSLMCLSWLFLFHVLSINQHLLEPHVELTFFPRERHRALLGVVLYILGGVTGWALSSMLALMIFLALPIF
jgi:hypothetical protein